MVDNCWGCGKAISEDDAPHSWGDEFCWKCSNMPTPGDDMKRDLDRPYEYLQDHYDETGELDI